MNIIIANDYAAVNGGAAQVAVVSARALADSGHNVYYVFASGDAAKALEHKNIKLINFEQFDLLNNPSRMSAAIIGIWNNDIAAKAKKFLKQFSATDTIIHIHGWVKSLSTSFLHVVLESKLPHVITLHDYFSACPNGGFYNYKSREICKLTAMSRSCLGSNCDVRSYSQKLWRFTRQVITAQIGVPKKISNFIYVSNFSRDILSPYFSNHSKLWNVPNPIDVEKLEPASPEHSEYFTYVGRLSAEKGVELFAHASSIIKAKARFVGSGELEEHLKSVNSDAEFTGWSNRESVTKHIRNSRAVVVPSLLYETQGMVVAETAAVGVPCIVADTCAGRDFVDDGVTGLWFKGGDVYSLNEAIKKLRDNKELAQEMGKNAYTKYWNNPPTIDAHLEALIACYQSIIIADKN
ncbi:glycosyltransferase family 4 protein [Pseudomonas sp. SIMBA_077]